MAQAALDRPAVTGGTWLRRGGVVVERTFAGALGVHAGDAVSVDGHPVRVLGTAATAAWAAYPFVDWHEPGSPLMHFGGLVWVDGSDIAALAGEQPLSYTLNLKLADPAASTAFVRASTAVDFRTWQDIADQDGRPVERAQQALLIGSWALAVLAVASVAGIVAGRIIGQRRRVGLLKAIGAGPAISPLCTSPSTL